VIRKLKFNLLTFHIILITAFLIFCTSAYANTPEEFYNKGNSDYRNNNFSKAIENYEKVLHFGIENDKLFYNLANAYFRIGELGKSIQFYEKALKINPKDNDINMNLELAKQMTEDEITLPSKNFFEKTISSYYNFFTAKELISLSSLLLSAILILLFSAIILNRRKTKLVILTTAVLSSFIFAIFLLHTIFKVNELRSKENAIILVEEINVKSGPEEGFTTVFTLHEGTKVRIRERRNLWYFISLENGMNGWIPQKNKELELLGVI